MNINAAFEWKCQPQAEKLLLDFLEKAIDLNPSIANLQKALLKYTSTRLFDWIDHIVLNKNLFVEEQLEACGFIMQGSTKDYQVYHHPGALLPRVVLNNHSNEWGIALTVESIADFLLVRGGSQAEILGTVQSPFRRCLVSTDKKVSMWVVERRGTYTLEPINETPEQLMNCLKAIEKWEKRPRYPFSEEEDYFSETLAIAQEMIDLVGQNRAAWIVLEVERKYWQSKNVAGQLQKNRQDRLGMGWANHDHHTFRSSRKNFKKLVHLFEMLGFHCRERYYAGFEAGWGAQIMENSACKLVLFLDVDLDPNEIEVDFAHEVLPDLPTMGTIGLWCALHGDSIMQAGMHHLEAQFMFEELSQDLAKVGVHMMQPFSSFDYLKQAFTNGEHWFIEPKRIEKLLNEKKITAEQAEKFLAYGAVGSHLENLQRREGYKGFNQKNVSLIIKKTDPRSYLDGSTQTS